MSLISLNQFRKIMVWSL